MWWYVFMMSESNNLTKDLKCMSCLLLQGTLWRKGTTMAGQDGPTMAGQDGPTMAGQDGPTMAGQDGPTMAGQDGLIHKDWCLSTLVQSIFQSAGLSCYSFCSYNSMLASRHLKVYSEQYRSCASVIRSIRCSPFCSPDYEQLISPLILYTFTCTTPLLVCLYIMRRELQESQNTQCPHT